ncbi:site-specific integrase [Glaesserella parasuis]|nr:site-specific integrase [Glaesserella parasuis]
MIDQINTRQEQQTTKSELVTKNENKAVTTSTVQHIIDEVIDDNENDDEQNNAITNLSQLGSPLQDNQDNQAEDYPSQIAHNFGLTPGMSIRRGQLVKLKIGDVDLSNRTIYISPEINKNHDYHIVPISDSLYIHMERLITELKIRKQTDNCQLFNLNLFSRCSRRRGQPMSQNQLTHIFRHISDLVGFTSSPHRFRHTVATQLMKKPENVYVVQKLLGHKDISVTLGYIEHDVEMLRDTVNLL